MVDGDWKLFSVVQITRGPVWTKSHRIIVQSVCGLVDAAGEHAESTDRTAREAQNSIIMYKLVKFQTNDRPLGIVEQ